MPEVITTGGANLEESFIDELADVDTTGVAEGDTLVYDADTSTWLVGEAATPPHLFLYYFGR